MTSRPPDAAWNNAERELLAAAREDRMPAELEARLREALDFAPGTTPASTGASASLRDTANARSLFASKLPLWGVLSLVALGAVSYYTLVPVRSQPVAAAPAPAQHDGAANAPRDTALSAGVGTGSLLRESTGHGVGASQRGTTVHEAAGGILPVQDVGALQRDDVALGERSNVREAGASQRDDSARGDRSNVRQISASQRDTVRGERPVVREAAPVPRDAARDARDGAPVPRDAARDARTGAREAAAHAAGGGGRAAVRGAAGSQRGVPARDADVVRYPAAQELSARSPQPIAATFERAATAPQSGRSDQLRIEAELLEHARSALGQAALSDARQWLARYQTQFAHGALQPESQVLGIELKVRTGAHAAAKAQANHFLAQHPNHPLRDRVRQLTEDSSPVR